MEELENNRIDAGCSAVVLIRRLDRFIVTMNNTIAGVLRVVLFKLMVLGGADGADSYLDGFVVAVLAPTFHEGSSRG